MSMDQVVVFLLFVPLMLNILLPLTLLACWNTIKLLQKIVGLFSVQDKAISQVTTYS